MLRERERIKKRERCTFSYHHVMETKMSNKILSVSILIFCRLLQLQLRSLSASSIRVSKCQQIERERGERGEAGEIERKIERTNLEKNKESEGGFNPEEGRKEGRKDGDFEREREKVMQGKLKFLAYELFLSNQGKQAVCSENATIVCIRFREKNLN